MNTVRHCGCKGVRTCLKCEHEFNIDKPNLRDELKKLDPWSWCIQCEMLYPGWDAQIVQQEHPNHKSESGLKLSGILVKENFLSFNEGVQVTKNLDALPWCISQSGRRKQNFGPKTNFKKRKLHNGQFNGFPASTEFIQKRLTTIEVLNNFQTIEQCSLEYDPKTGASIDPHIDDCWIWGERVVTVNCLGDAVLTLTLFENVLENEFSDIKKYNLDLVSSYKYQLITSLLKKPELAEYKGKVIRIPMPILSLIVLYGPARYQFEHSVLREDIAERRICLAYREFTPMYLKAGIHGKKGQEVLVNAQHFWTTPLQLNKKS